MCVEKSTPPTLLDELKTIMCELFAIQPYSAVENCVCMKLLTVFIVDRYCNYGVKATMN